jgi:Tfp pilus assembly protein FimT
MGRKGRWPAGGYTLVEVLIVVCLMGLLAGLLAPRWSAYAAHLRVRAASNRLVGDIAYTRMMAVRTGRSAALVLEPSADCSVKYRGRLAGHRYHVVPAGSTDAAFRTVDARASGGRTCLEMNGADSAMVFNSRGLPRGVNNRTFWVHEHRFADSVAVSAVGRVLRR